MLLWDHTNGDLWSWFTISNIRLLRNAMRATERWASHRIV